jgi:hypothetical protein
MSTWALPDRDGSDPANGSWTASIRPNDRPEAGHATMNYLKAGDVTMNYLIVMGT